MMAKLVLIAGVLIITLSLTLHLTTATSRDVRYCNSKAKYAVKVSGLDIEPYPISRGRNTTFQITASTDEVISSGKLVIDVSYFGFYIHSENHDLCKETSCPVSVGDFVVAHSQELPGITPPGSYTLKMTMVNEKNKQLTCISFDFSMGFIGENGAAVS